MQGGEYRGKRSRPCKWAWPSSQQHATWPYFSQVEAARGRKDEDRGTDKGNLVIMKQEKGGSCKGFLGRKRGNSQGGKNKLFTRSWSPACIIYRTKQRVECRGHWSTTWTKCC